MRHFLTATDFISYKLHTALGTPCKNREPCSTLRILVTVGSARRMSPGFGWMLAFSAVFNLGANSLKGGEEERERHGVKGRWCIVSIWGN